MYAIIHVLLLFIEGVVSILTPSQNSSFDSSISTYKSSEKRLEERSKINTPTQHSLLSWNKLGLSLANIRLDEFVENLKSYVRGTEFSLDLFNTSANIHKAELAEITSKIESASFSSERLSQKLRHAQYTLETMHRAIPKLKLFNISGSSDEHLIHCLVELNLMILGLYDSYGEPDCRRMGYAYRLYQYKNRLEFLVVEFRKILNVSTEVCQVFDQEYVQARESLEELMKHLD